jgi:hypothetical protein
MAKSELTPEERYAPRASDTPEQSAKRKEAKRKWEDRQKEKIEELAAEEISVIWKRHSEALLKADPKKYEELSERHLDIKACKWEVNAVRNGVWGVLGGKNLRAADLPASGEYHAKHFPRPDLCFEDVLAESKHGMMNTRAIEASPDFRPQIGVKPDLTSAVDCYRYFGFQTRINSDDLRIACESLIEYFVKTKDPLMDQEIVKQAFDLCEQIWVSHGIRESVREHLNPTPAPEPPKAPPKFEPLSLPLPEPPGGWQVSRSIDWPRTK